MTNEKKVVLNIITGFIALSIFSWLPTPEAKDLIRFAINCILCWFLYKGANWSRWVMAVLASLASVVTAVALIKLPGQITTTLGLVVIFFFYSSAAVILLSQKFIKNHFAPVSI
ncbi:hypothetical protein [Aeromonas rivipollensis]|uniref:hypothetical protein n=1 Tax=Aeromonas rivipollensis TaxID=948519 RepID=UPI001F4499F2|nr:hypothetical protein [Aeromonas rivipollensis]MCE9942542.1 hypothetical protein [Aeromonas rivipollensis]